jgi:hypothetical protein
MVEIFIETLIYHSKWSKIDKFKEIIDLYRNIYNTNSEKYKINDNAFDQ